MEIHELCSKMPEIEGEQFEQLKNDIEAKGLVHPILVYEGKIIDGKNRLHALQELNIKPTLKNGMLKKWEGKPFNTSYMFPSRKGPFSPLFIIIVGIIFILFPWLMI